MSANRSVVTQTIELSQMNCGQCGGTYAINEAYRAHKYQNKGYWNCPYCQCSWGYGKQSEFERTKQELKDEQARHERTLARANEAEAERRKSEAALQRHQKRTKAGVCPCCNRSFVALARHMKTKHPTYAGEK